MSRLHSSLLCLLVLPTTTFFYGLCQDEEIQVHIQAGKTLFIKGRFKGLEDQLGSGLFVHGEIGLSNIFKGSNVELSHPIPLRCWLLCQK